MALYQDQVITLKARPYRDHDALVTVFARQNGKFSAVARGVRRPKSKLAGQLRPLTVSVATFYHGRSSLDTVTEADLEHGFSKLADNLERLSWAMVLADIVDQLVPERETAKDSFTVLKAALKALHEGRHAASVGLRTGFLLLAAAGFAPDWTVCSDCHQPLVRGPVAISVQGGSVHCPACQRHLAQVEELISLGSLRSLQYWLNDSPSKFGQFEVKGLMEEELKRLLFRYMLHETARPLKSYEFLMNIDRLQRGPEGGSKR
ncbi:MAG: DNA repair protein RecO [Sulfobacillus acidophilus]|uniref:DNA repair protein RecO n=1 Tax=Sulfobacillus acidophilus TaxID=53633 RepID=A0A2T2WN66_9FIRM|nr:MAG: DNA repair protein RecO [Sulfobacillus acidophilus]